jgi:hypothetical protein
MPKEWDVFISHASEDKDDFVRPLAQALAQLGVKVWYDEFTLVVGDSLSRSIDRGLTASTYGIVIISPSFIEKKWPERELRGLVAREIEEEQKVILPIWLGVTKDQVLEFSPPLADTIAIRTEGMSAEEISLGLLKTIRPDIYKEHDRAELETMVNGEALKYLQDELENVKYELSEYRCPHCQAPLTERIEVEPEPDIGGGGLVEDFECGYSLIDGAPRSLCPCDPEYPKLEEYEFVKVAQPVENGGFYGVEMRPLTARAKNLRFQIEYAATEEEARQRLTSRYERRARPWRG